MASLEAALDEEMKEVVAMLESNTNGGGRRADSPSMASRARSPGSAASPIRSMLDVDAHSQRRSSSRGSTGIPFAMPSSPRRVNPEAAYKFNMSPSIDAQTGGKRVSQTSYPAPKPRAMSSVYGTSSGLLGAGPNKERHNSASTPYTRSKSGSPAPHRSISPATHATSPPSSPGPRSSSVIASDSEKQFDGGAGRKDSDATEGNTTAPGGGVRLTTDDDGDGDGDESAAVESSQDDSDSSDWDDGSVFASKAKKGERGRRRTRKESGGTDSMGREIITAKSLFAEAVSEGKCSFDVELG